MEKSVMAAASSYNKKFFLDPDYSSLPDDIKKDIQIIAVTIAERINGIFSIGFYEDGSVFLEASGDSIEYDEIGAGLEVERLKREKRELLNSLSLWYRLWFNDEGYED